MGSATSPQKPDLAVTSVRIERDKLDRLRDIAEGHRRTVTQEINWLIDQAIAEAEGDEFPA